MYCIGKKTLMVADLTPCIICESSVLRAEGSTYRLKNACRFTLHAHQPSNFENNVYEGIICDSCIDKLIQSSKILAYI